MDASYILSELGGCFPVAKRLGYAPSTVQNWKNRDNIPPEYWPDLIKLAVKLKKNIGIEHFIKLPHPDNKKNKYKKPRS